jgi:hypothetical protein
LATFLRFGRNGHYAGMYKSISPIGGFVGFQSKTRSRTIPRSRVRANERFRHSDIFRTVFERVVEACIRAGLVGGEGFAVDASLIVADANKQRSIPTQSLQPSLPTKQWQPA